jgi:transposase
LLERIDVPEPWKTNVEIALTLIDDLDLEIQTIEAELKRSGATHPYVQLLTTAPGIGWVLGYTIASEIGDIHRFESTSKFVGYTGLTPRVIQSGNSDRRGPLAKNGPRYLRWALIEAAVHASRHPAYKEHYDRTAQRLGRQRGRKVARVEVARKLAEAIWHMCQTGAAFAPRRGPSRSLAA